MRYFVLFILSWMAGCVLLANATPLATESPVGYWKTIDDITGKPKSVVQITETAHHTLMGKVITIFSKQPGVEHKLCTACEGDNHNQPIVGLVILSGLKAADGEWNNGKITDPLNGKTYKCITKLYPDGKRLLVRGYIGLPLLGRSQTWVRVDSPSIVL